MDLNPDIFAQQNENKDNPHKTKHVDECTKALGGNGNSYSSSDEIGMTKTFNDRYYLDVIGTSNYLLQFAKFQMPRTRL